MFWKTKHGEPTSNGQAQGGGRKAFGYYFPKSGVMPHSPERLAALDALGEAMIDNGGSPNLNSTIPPVFTYFGQFIDHDITGGTDREQFQDRIDNPDLRPLPRNIVVDELQNERSGHLDLDSLYGNAELSFAAQESEANKAFLDVLAKLMRFPADTAKMRIAFFDGKQGGVTLPADRAGDVLRLGRLLDDTNNGVTKTVLQGLTGDLREAFLETGTNVPIRQRAIIGDARNDENLIVAQLHLAFLRVHNTIVDVCTDADVPVEDREAVHAWARKNLTRIYQWMVVNLYLPAICDPDAYAQVVASGGKLYSGFRDALDAPDDVLPLPLEFSVAAFRFGHTMVRAEYDWNDFFGRSAQAPDATRRATFQDMFDFTGNGRLKMVADRLPSIWGADWQRLIEGPSPAAPDRAARRIDTRISLPLFMLPEGKRPGVNILMSILTRRNLRRGYMMNLPSAQACIDGVEAALGITLPRLTPAQMGDGVVGEALDRDGLRTDTPLWYYILREAEVLEDGARLGPLGTHLVAGTLFGLIVADPESYWNQPGTDGDRWRPADGAQPNGKVVATLSDFFEAGLLL